mmetsp:Transcript_44676/g.136279  ORF Transcript_44676/g.136279 Transcript_44676/m.136279 type:complete len:508 (-) Transcript_44676:310-1833(-)
MMETERHQFRIWLVLPLLLPLTIIPVSSFQGRLPVSSRFSLSQNWIVDRLRKPHHAKGESDLLNLKQREVEFILHPSISSIPAEEWDRCGNQGGPFTSHAWLLSLEESECASPKTGWIPQHLELKVEKKFSSFLPMYIKGHSLGEFIFDNGWADAAHRNGIQYYPKLLVGVPFTPVTGERILLHPHILQTYLKEEISELRSLTARFLKQIALSNKISSVHLNFITAEEASDISGPIPEPKETSEEDKLKGRVQSMLDQLTYKDKNDYLRRTSMQYHWVNSNAKNSGKPYESFEDYLNAFKSKRRITIKRERRRVTEDAGIRVDAVVGEDILRCEGLVAKMFDIYSAQIKKMLYGRQYLTEDFFHMLTNTSFIENLCFMCARHADAGEELKAEDVFAGTVNIVKDGVFYGRYWGCLPGKEVKNLHFETCYWSAIEHCIKAGLSKMEPGAGGGDYKWARGFDPALIHSAHYICHPGLRRAVSQFIDFETENNVEVSKYLLSRSVVGRML